VIEINPVAAHTAEELISKASRIPMPDGPMIQHLIGKQYVPEKVAAGHKEVCRTFVNEEVRRRRYSNCFGRQGLEFAEARGSMQLRKKKWYSQAGRQKGVHNLSRHIARLCTML
jgi:hypothetical protein